MKQEYIERITEELNKTDDLSMLDLIFQLITKANRRANNNSTAHCTL